MSIDRRHFGLNLATAACMAIDSGAQAQDAMPKSANGKTPSRRGQPTIVAFDAAGALDASGKTWHVPTEIWAHRPQDSAFRKGVIAAVLRKQYGLEPTAATQPLFDRRVNLLLADNASRVVPSVRFGSNTIATFPPTGANGHAIATVRVPADNGVPMVSARLPITVTGGTGGQAHLVAPTGVSVISDIDDTVKDSGVLNKRQLWQSTFFQPFKAVPGMANLVSRLAGPDGGVHYVSSTPWHLYAPLREWLDEAKFPVSSLHLKQIRLKDQTILDIFKSPETLKPPIIAGLLRRWPGRRFVLLGDSGEKDPEVYGQIARQFPEQVIRILIRRAPGDASTAPRFTTAFESLDRGLWQVFDAPGEVTWTP